MAKATWTVQPSAPAKAADGTVTVAAALLDAGVKAADLTFTITADRVLTVRYRPVTGAAGLAGFQAWEG